MRNYRLFFAALLLVFIGACSKEEPKNNQEFKESIEDPTGLIKSFVHKMEMHKEGSILKSGQAMTVDSAIWYIDATINYTYANASHPFAKIHRDTIYIEMKLVNSYEASYEDVVDVYNSYLNALSLVYYEEVDDENKKFIMTRVDNLGPLPGNKQKLRFISTIGVGMLKIDDGDFGTDDAFWWNRNATVNCFLEPSDGAPIIFESMLLNYFEPQPPTNCRWFYYGTTDVVTLYYYNYQLNSTLINYLDYKIYSASPAIGNGLTDEVTCLEFNHNNSGVHEMQFYYNHLKDFVNEWIASSQNTGNKKLSDIFIDSKTNDTPPFQIYHLPTMIYRKRGIACNAASEIPGVL